MPTTKRSNPSVPAKAASKLFSTIKGGVLAPLGFVGGVAACGIKNGKATRDDLALIASTTLSAAAGTFTTNKVKAAPVLVSMENIRNGFATGVILNSGNANACTGEEGLTVAWGMAEAAAGHLDASKEDVLVCSTGRIGVQLPLDRVKKGLDGMQLFRKVGTQLAKSIMTSDTFPKEIALAVKTPQGTFRIGAMAKGAGMIDPTMATMLCVVTCDAEVSSVTLRKTLRKVVENSFNRITVDGDMSTNDTVIMLANGRSGVNPDESILEAAMEHVCVALARIIVLDGEGVSKFVEIEVRGANTAKDAKLAAEAVANSTLVKCAWAGNDPNWGRIMDALGYSGAKMEEARTSIDYGGLPIVRQGVLAPTPWSKLRAVAAGKQFRITIDLGYGVYAHEVWTTDLTEEYVRLNLGE